MPHRVHQERQTLGTRANATSVHRAFNRQQRLLVTLTQMCSWTPQVVLGGSALILGSDAPQVGSIVAARSLAAAAAAPHAGLKKVILLAKNK